MTPKPAQPRLEWRGVSKRFGDKLVLDGVDLAVDPGRSLVVIGGSGQGKSVLIKIAAGLLRADGGEVRLDGQPLAPGAAHAPGYGFLFQGAALFDSLPVWENIAFRLLHADGLPRRAARARALDAMDRVRLPASAADQRPNELSGGMQKRAGLARAIIADPDILFFDEPTTGLDPVTGGVIDALIVEQVRRLGCTAVSITHDMVSARRIADRIAMLHAGRIVWQGSADEVDHSGHPLVDQFVSGRSEP
ncbi:MAG: ATP-binding cassette domain-containing protein [Proteobacteria bacterium]|nr:ATP-binding cassette domain-containing protein [Pseudomonadota bacterium]